MKKKIYSILVLIYIVVLQVILISCNDVVNEDKTVDIILDKGAYVNEVGNEYNIYNLLGKEKVDTDKVITNYNIESNTYLYYKDGVYYANYSGHEIKLSERRILAQKISPDGEYVFYFINEEYLKPKVFDLKNGEEISIDNKAIISGQFIDWIDKETLAFYGVDNENKTSGIFTYNILSKKETLIYKVESGYIEFLKYVDNGILFIEQRLGDDALLKIVNLNSEVTQLYDKISEVYDVQVSKNGIYVLGKMKNNVYSLYEISNNEAKRLVYDFPLNIKLEKGLSLDNEGKVLFVGANSDSNEEMIYKYSDGEVSSIEELGGNYHFINVN